MPYKKTVPVMLEIPSGNLCRTPYHGHKKGCPNYGNKPGCPPNVKQLNLMLDFAKPFYVIWNWFDLDAHKKRMLEKHPGWSDRQAGCCLYWQQGARKLLGLEIQKFRRENKNDNYFVTRIPEAHGLNVTETMKNAGIILEWPPIYNTYQVAIAGIIKDSLKYENRRKNSLDTTREV